MRRALITTIALAAAIAVAAPSFAAGSRATVKTRHGALGTFLTDSFFQDAKAGDTHGEGVNGFGAQWFVLAPSGRRIEG